MFYLNGIQGTGGGCQFDRGNNTTQENKCLDSYVMLNHHAFPLGLGSCVNPAHCGLFNSLWLALCVSQVNVEMHESGLNTILPPESFLKEEEEKDIEAVALCVF